MLSANVHVKPEITDETRAFWEGANKDKLLLKRCLKTDKPFFPPRSHSPFTGLNQTEWFEASGEGTIYSFSVVERDDMKSCIAYIALSEGPIMLSAVVNCEVEALFVEQKVRAVFISHESGQKVPMFVPKQ